MTYKIDDKDLFMIVSYSKDKMLHLNLPVFVNRKEVEHGSIPSLAILEGILMFLNSKKLLSQFVEVDYTFEYDDNDSTELEEKEPVQ